jgi:hypothetical protein
MTLTGLFGVVLVCIGYLCWFVWALSISCCVCCLWVGKGKRIPSGGTLVMGLGGVFCAILGACAGLCGWAKGKRIPSGGTLVIGREQVGGRVSF